MKSVTQCLMFALTLAASLSAQVVSLGSVGGAFDPSGSNYSLPFKISGSAGTGQGCPDCPTEVVSVSIDAKTGSIGALTTGLSGTVTASSVNETLSAQVGANPPVVGSGSAVANVVVSTSAMTGTSNATPNATNAVGLVGPGVFSHLDTVITYKITVAHEDCKCTYEIHIKISHNTNTGAPVSATAW